MVNSIYLLRNNRMGLPGLSVFWLITTGADAEDPILWPPDVKSKYIAKDPDAGKDWRQEEKGATEYEMVGWNHRLNGHEFVLAPWIGDGQGGLVWWSPRGHKKSDMTEWLNWTKLNCCASFCCKAKWIIFTCTYIHSFFRFCFQIDRYRVLNRVL